MHAIPREGYGGFEDFESIASVIDKSTSRLLRQQTRGFLHLRRDCDVALGTQIPGTWYIVFRAPDETAHITWWLWVSTGDVRYDTIRLLGLEGLCAVDVDDRCTSYGAHSCGWN